MDKMFICLANSYKKISEDSIGATGRCIAGIEISIKKYDEDRSISVITENSTYGVRPQWIRPIDRNTKTGAIPVGIASKIDIYDIILLSDVELCGATGAHSENVFYREIQKVGRFDGKNVHCLVDTLHKNYILGNKKRTLDENFFRNFDHSLMLARVYNLKFYYEERTDGKTKLRAKFQYGCQNIVYDFPVTDPKFLDRAHTEKDVNGLPGINGEKERYMVFSLGLPYNREHYKLITTVLDTID